MNLLFVTRKQYIAPVVGEFQIGNTETLLTRNQQWEVPPLLLIFPTLCVAYGHC
jgi:hypothetical protein